MKLIFIPGDLKTSVTRSGNEQNELILRTNGLPSFHTVNVVVCTILDKFNDTEGDVVFHFWGAFWRTKSTSILAGKSFM